MVLFVNGIPVVTIELKTPTTNQTVEDAVKQYKARDHRQQLFRYAERALVHFAVDPESAYMATRLSGKQTRFLPFNIGRDGGAGNPDNPAGYKTAYLWEDVWQRDSLLDLVQRFINIEYPPGTKKKDPKKGVHIFPRYHQRDVVRQLEAHARQTGPGHNYLVQHSAGSGKSNSIAWTAHRLYSLHNEANERVFHSVVVITDRRVLDQQLQDTIYGIEHQFGVVHRIDENSQQLADALATGAPIIISTLQKFPVVIEKIGGLPDRNYAVIVDEAHSSQTGEAARKLRQVLTTGGIANLRRRRRGRHRHRRGGAAGHRSVGPPAQPELLRLHRHPEAEDAGDVRHGRRRRQAPPVPRVLDAPGHRGGLHPGCARQLHDVRPVLQAHQGHRGRPGVRVTQGAAGDRPVRATSTPPTWRRRPR